MPKITFLENGTVLEAAEGASFLEVCQAADVPQDFGCTVGSCGTCALVIVEGAANVPPITDEEKETLAMCTDDEGARLGCQLVLNGDISVRAADV